MMPPLLLPLCTFVVVLVMILTPLKCHTRLYKQIKFGIDILLTYLKEHGEQRIALCLYNILDEEF